MTGYIADAIAAELPFLRAEAEARMTSRCTIHRKSGAMTTGPNGYELPGWLAVATEVPLRLAGPGSAAPYKTETPSQSEVNYGARVLAFPASLADLQNDDLVEITMGESAGTVWRIIEASWQDQATARRVPAERIERPSEWSQP